MLKFFAPNMSAVIDGKIAKNPPKHAAIIDITTTKGVKEPAYFNALIIIAERMNMTASVGYGPILSDTQPQTTRPAVLAKAIRLTANAAVLASSRITSWPMEAA